MSQNPRFKKKFDELREGNPAKRAEDQEQEENENSNDNEFYDRPGNTRNVRFAWPDGRMKFFNYAYLVSCEIDVKDDANIITIEFTSEVVTLKGYKLQELFLALFSQIPCMITQVDPRYVSNNEDTYSVTEIIVSNTSAEPSL